MAKQEVLEPKINGGARPGAGRKAFDQNFEDRRILSMWLCDWFTRQYFIVNKINLKDGDAESVVNECFRDGLVFKDEPATNIGKKWNAAKRGERPFSNDRMTMIATAAEKLNLWRAGLCIEEIEDDLLTVFILRMLAVDGFHSQDETKKQFDNLQLKLRTALKDLLNPTKQDFAKRKARVLKTLNEWKDFADDYPKNAGEIGLRRDVLASFENWDSDIRAWKLRPSRSIKLITPLKLGGNFQWVQQTLQQVEALHFETHLFYDRALTINPLKSKTGTKLAQ